MPQTTATQSEQLGAWYLCDPALFDRMDQAGRDSAWLAAVAHDLDA